jgi:hypothetical protein
VKSDCTFWNKTKTRALLFIIVSSVDVLWPDFKVTCA